MFHLETKSCGLGGFLPSTAFDPVNGARGRSVVESTVPGWLPDLPIFIGLLAMKPGHTPVHPRVVPGCGVGPEQVTGISVDDDTGMHRYLHSERSEKALPCVHLAKGSASRLKGQRSASCSATQGLFPNRLYRISA